MLVKEFKNCHAKWNEGQVREQLTNRSYIVTCNGNLVRRNRQHLQPLSTNGPKTTPNNSGLDGASERHRDNKETNSDNAVEMRSPTGNRNKAVGHKDYDFSAKLMIE